MLILHLRHQTLWKATFQLEVDQVSMLQHLIPKLQLSKTKDLLVHWMIIHQLIFYFIEIIAGQIIVLVVNAALNTISKQFFCLTFFFHDLFWHSVNYFTILSHYWLCSERQIVSYKWVWYLPSNYMILFYECYVMLSMIYLFYSLHPLPPIITFTLLMYDSLLIWFSYTKWYGKLLFAYTYPRIYFSLSI